MDPLGPAFDFLRFLTTSFELRAVDRSVFRHLLPRPAPPAPQSLLDILRRHRSPSHRPANVYWLEEVVGSVAQRFGEWASASRTFSTITDLIAVVEREVDRLCSCSSLCMHAPPPPACLLRLLLTAATFPPSRHHHQTWEWRALSPYATASVPGCLCDGTGTLYRLFSVT